MKLNRVPVSARLLALLFITQVGMGCSSGGSSEGTSENPPTDSPVSIAPEGDINGYGVINLSDENGQVSDLVGSFYRLDTGVSESFLRNRVSGNSTFCEVQDDDVIDFEEISVGYVPDVPGIGKTAVGAGDSVVLNSAEGIYATLTQQPAGGFLFYDLPNMTALSTAPVPDGLSVAFAGSDVIPEVQNVAMPVVSPLTGFAYAGNDTVSTSTQFTWNSTQEADAFIRIFVSTAGGFFLEDGVTVTCITPDTGSFSFPASTQTLLGSEFSGAPPIASRVAANAVLVDSSLIYILRESFAPE